MQSSSASRTASGFPGAARNGASLAAIARSEYQIQLRDYGVERAHGCALLPTRYDLVSAAFGGHGELVANVHELPRAVEGAHRSGLPACINVMIEGVAAPRIRR